MCKVEFSITAALGPHPKSLSLRARDFKTLPPFSLREKGTGDEGRIRYLLL